MAKVWVLFLLLASSIVTHAQKWEKSVLLGKYSISFPADWIVENGYDETDSLLFAIISPPSSKNDGFSEHVSVHKHTRQEIKDIRKEADATIAYLKQQFSDFKVKGKVQFREDKEFTGFTFVYTSTADGKPWYFYASMLDDGKYLYNLMFTGPEREMKKYLPTVKKMYASFKVLQ